MSVTVWLQRFRKAWNGTATFIVELDVDHETEPDWIAEQLEQIAEFIRVNGVEETEMTLTNSNGFVIGSVELV